jgi:hypothetical protein
MMRLIEKFVYISNILFLTSYLLSFLALLPLKKKVTILPILSACMCGFLISQLGLENLLEASSVIGVGILLFLLASGKKKFLKKIK